MSTWTEKDIDDLSGKVILLTGGSSGIGKECARELARKGAELLIASDDQARGQGALQELKRELPKARISFEQLDLGSELSISTFCDRFLKEHSKLDILINNAALAGIPKRMESTDGHEMIFAVNYLGHFSLTAQLFPLLLRGGDPRVIFVSSVEHKNGFINFDDLEFHQGYSADKAYAQSKLAMLMMALELHQRCQASGIRLKSIPVHPGASSTHIFDRGPEISGQYFHPRPLVERIVLKLVGQKAQTGALPLLFAATSVEARSGVYYGPDGPLEWWGKPTEVEIAVQAENQIARDRLWADSEKITGHIFDIESTRTIGLH